MTMPEQQRCAAVREDGRSCGVRVLVDGRHCFAHAPEHEAARREARQRGGRNRATAIRLRTLTPPRLIDVYGRLEGALAETHTGTLDPRTATAMASLARALVAVLTAGELEERVRKLEGRGSR